MAAPERVGSGIPLLEYGDFIAVRRTILSPILGPRMVPIHPLVYESPRVYTPEFGRRVWASVPDSIRQDIATINAMMKPSYVPIEVTDKSVSLTYHEPTQPDDVVLPGDIERFEDFVVDANPARKSIELRPRDSADALNIWIEASNKGFLTPAREHPMPREKAKKYEIDPRKYQNEGMIMWHAHNIGNSRLPIMLIFRNFAIMFNNLGLQDLGIK